MEPHNHLGNGSYIEGVGNSRSVSALQLLRSNTEKMYVLLSLDQLAKHHRIPVLLAFPLPLPLGRSQSQELQPSFHLDRHLYTLL